MIAVAAQFVQAVYALFAFANVTKSYVAAVSSVKVADAAIAFPCAKVKEQYGLNYTTDCRPADASCFSFLDQDVYIYLLFI